MKRSNSLLKRSAAIFLLLIFIQSSFLPNYAWALTTGPHQPEYISYEEPGATDMVNLSTGDFTFSLPVLEVPGPEGSFSLPLSYHAGIGLDQEASWVGLGWTMNAGAITRSINGLPDDAKGETQSIHVQDLTGVRGWQSNFLGSNIGWNNQVGHYGSVSIFGSINYNYEHGGFKSIGIAGNSITVGKSGIGFNAEAFTLFVAETALTIATAGIGETAVVAAETIAKQAAVGLAVQTVVDAAYSGAAPNAPTIGNWEYSRKSSQKFFHKDYMIWLDKTRFEDMYGILYLDAAKLKPYPVQPIYPSINLKVNGSSTILNQFEQETVISNKGAASDINYFFDENQSYKDANGPVSLATDAFTVRGMGISGSIKPYRFEAGSVSMPREMTSNHIRLNPLPYETYKVPFLYEGGISNNYYHNVGSSSTVTAPTFYAGVNHSVANQTSTIQLNDITFGSTQRFRSTDAAPYKKIAQNNHVEWFSNTEILNGSAASNGFMDFLDVSQRTIFRQFQPVNSTSYFSFSQDFTDGGALLSKSDALTFTIGDIVKIDLIYPSDTDYDGNQVYSTQHFDNVHVDNILNDPNQSNTSTIILRTSDMPGAVTTDVQIQIVAARSSVSSTGIGGYSITRGDGLTFHYSLPVYDYNYFSKVTNIADAKKNSTIARGQAFANSWLLTAITGSDFIDRNNSGTVDRGDWGYWVKFNYGNQSNNFQWRLPYASETVDLANVSKTYSQGSKQLFYLNSIETRTHKSIFIKSPRYDSKGYDNVGTSLELDEVCLLKIEDFDKLIAPVASGGYGLANCDNTVNKIWAASDFYSGSTYTSAGQFIKQASIKRVKFIYDYSLCKGTLNSSDVNKGKLTLRRVSLVGANDNKIVPDYLFDYDNNPDYNSDRWDAWGLYNSLGTSSPTTHKSTGLNSDGAAWSLTKVITPLGNELSITYERDTYNKVSGEPLMGGNNSTFSASCTCVPVSGISSLNVANANLNFSVGDEVTVNGNLSYNCSGSGVQFSFTASAVINAVSASSIILTTNVGGSSNYCSPFSSQFISYSGTIQRKNVPGGDLRVSSIAFKADGTESKIRYLYNDGVISKEPEFQNTYKYSFYNLPNYPITPVIYSSVEVFNGAFSTGADYHTRQVYNFETPNKTFVASTSDVVEASTLYATKYDGLVPYYGLNSTYHHKVDNYSSKMGSLKSVKTYDGNYNLKSSTTIDYTDNLPGAQGIFTESSIMAERLTINEWPGFWIYDKLNRTTIRNFPWTVQKITTQNDGFTAQLENKQWDFFTGKVLEKTQTSSLGLRIKTVIVPAYTQYSTMGPKAAGSSNKNMLTQDAANYVYKIDGAGTTVGLISASIQTWKNSWTNYRVWNGTAFTDSEETISAANPVWRKEAAYAWRGNYSGLQPDGTRSISAFTDFNFATNASNPLWIKAGEVKRYDHYSTPLETVDQNQMYASTKKGYNDRYNLSSAGNASYSELAFSSAEDLNTSTNFFGGEVALGNGTVVSSATHTGVNALQLSSGYGFIYKPTGLKPNRIYRAAVWSNSNNGRIYFKLNNGAEQISLVPTKQVGGWYLSELEIPVGTTFTSLEVGVKSASGTVLFDDFRFQPIDAAMSANVLMQSTGALQYVLDNNNLFTKYEYNDRGLIIKTYKESFLYGVKLVSETKDNYKRFNTQQ
jgi:hypothetical protein